MRGARRQKGSFYVARWTEEGGEARDVLANIVTEVTRDLPWPKSMRWAETTFRWVRPLHNILAIFDGAPLVGGVETGDGMLAFSDQTRGHRFMAPDTFTVSGYDDYVAKLNDARVMVESHEREKNIRAQMTELCAANGLAVPEDDGLYREVTGLVEWPTVLLGGIDDAFMALPREVLTSSMREHQKYFAVSDGADGLVPKFVFVSNISAADLRPSWLATSVFCGRACRMRSISGILICRARSKVMCPSWTALYSTPGWAHQQQ